MKCMITTIAAGGANNSQSGEECLYENTEIEDPDQARTFSRRTGQSVNKFIINLQGVNEGNKFDWDEQQQGLVLSGFSYGYFATQVLGGLLAQKYGGKWVYLIACGGSVILGLLVPVAASTDIILLVVLRALQGAFQGAQTPAFFTLTTKWLPESERARSFTFICTGAQFGTIVTLATWIDFISYWMAIHFLYFCIFWDLVVRPCDLLRL